MSNKCTQTSFIDLIENKTYLQDKYKITKSCQHNSYKLKDLNTNLKQIFNLNNYYLFNRILDDENCHYFILDKLKAKERSYSTILELFDRQDDYLSILYKALKKTDS